MVPTVKTIIFPVKDLAQAKNRFSALLGMGPAVDGEYYIQFEADNQKIGLDPNGHGKGMTGPVAYWHVADIHASLKVLVDGGAQVQQEISDVGGGKLVASVTDTDGNVVALVQEP